MTSPGTSPRVASARPEVTYAIMGETGLDENVLRKLVQTFYARIRRDAVLGLIFESTVIYGNAAR
jgi:hemoglobin